MIVELVHKHIINTVFKNQTNYLKRSNYHLNGEQLTITVGSFGLLDTKSILSWCVFILLYFKNFDEILIAINYELFLNKDYVDSFTVVLFYFILKVRYLCSMMINIILNRFKPLY